MTADQFLDQLEAQSLLDSAMIAKLRKKAAQSSSDVSAKNLASALVKQGHLTKFQAKKLLTEMKPSSGSTKAAAGSAKAPADDLALVSDDESVATDEDQLAPLDDEGDLEPLEDDGLEPLDDDGLEPVADEGLEPLDDDGLEPVADEGLEPLDDDGLEPVQESGGLEMIDEGGGLETLDAGGLESFDDPMMGGGQLQYDQHGQPPSPGFKKKEAAKKPWESPLILLGGGALALLLIAGTILFFSLSRGTAAEMFQQAEEAYRSGAYSQAISIYEKFLGKYPDDPSASLARVKIGTAQIWQRLEGSSDKRAALEEAKKVLPKIENEEAFSQVRAELASILPDIAEGFSAPAEKTEDIAAAQELVDLAEESMTLVNNPSYIPTSLRRSVQTRIDKILEGIANAKRNINRTKRLAAAVAEIRTLAEADKTQEAYAVRRALLKEYPGLDRHPDLLASVLLITERERGLVKVVNQPIAPATDDHPKKSLFRVTLISRRGQGFAGNDRQAVYFLARGAVFALKAPTGELLWRRYVGHQTIYQPIPLSRQAGADVLVCDTLHQELARLDGLTGELKWRLPIGEPFAYPQLYSKRALVATDSGRLLDVDTDGGAATQHAVIPQNLDVGPGTSDRRHLYQVGDHSNLYVLDEDNLQCKEVYYLGHKAGTIVTPPVMALGHLFIAENNAADACDLHVLAVDANGLKVKPAMPPIRLKGRVVVPPLLYSGRVVTVTDLGEIRVFEVNSAKPDKPVSEAVKAMVASFNQPLIGFATVEAGALYVGNDRLTKYSIQTARHQLNREWIKDERDVWDAAPVVLGDTVFDMRRRRGSPSFTISARNTANGTPLWEADVAAPMALTNVELQKREIHAISAQAELFEVVAEAFQAGGIDQPATNAVGASRTVAFNEVVDFGDGRFALASPQDRRKAVIYNPKSVSKSGRLETVAFSAAADAAATTAPTYFQDGLIVPLDDGQIVLADPKTGNNKLLPFQPQVAAGSKIEWQRPAVVEGGASLVIADNRRNLYRVGVEQQPEPHLDRLALAQLAVDIVSPLAAAGDVVYGVTRSGTEDTLVAFAAGDLSTGKEFPLAGRVMWGPQTVGGLVMVATDRGGLKCFDANQAMKWQAALPYGPLAGVPMIDGNTYLLASRDGIVWRISGADGSELAKMDLEEPLASGPLPFSGRLLISTADGTMLVTNTPPAAAGN